MDAIEITGREHRLYAPFERLYAGSFPLFEQRTPAQQAQAFASDRYRLIGYESGGRWIGFVSCWELDGSVYIEHLAVAVDARGQGWGGEMLRRFIGSTAKIVLLEIDPVTDEVSAARLRFYHRCGFCENPYPHRHPPYRREYAPHPLVILSSGRPISEPEYRWFRRDLSDIVMGGAAGGADE